MTTGSAQKQGGPYQRCEGMTGVGACTNRAKFEVVCQPVDDGEKPRPAESFWCCGLHAMQRVKWALRQPDAYYNGVTVNRI